MKIEPDDMIEWCEPLADGNEPMTMRAKASDIAAVRRRQEPRYETDEEAVQDFVVVHWANVIPAHERIPNLISVLKATKDSPDYADDPSVPISKPLLKMAIDSLEHDEEFEGLNGRLSALLEGVCVALKGPSAPNRAHSWHDLPELAAVTKAACENYVLDNSRLVDCIDDLERAALSNGNWQQYAKDGENAQQCIERHRMEHDALLNLLRKEKEAREALERMQAALLRDREALRNDEGIVRIKEGYSGGDFDKTSAYALGMGYAVGLIDRYTKPLDELFRAFDERGIRCAAQSEGREPTVETLDSTRYAYAAAVMGTCPDGPTDDALKRAIVAYLGGKPWPDSVALGVAEPRQ